MKKFNTLRGFLTGIEPEDMKSEFAYHATLRISNDTNLNFGAISDALGLAPTITVKKGDKVGPHSPKSKHNIWMYRAPVSEERDINEHIDVLWKALKPNVDYLCKLKSQATVDVFLGYSSNIDHAGIQIKHQSLEMFTSLEIDFGLSIVVLTDE